MNRIAIDSSSPEGNNPPSRPISLLRASSHRPSQLVKIRCGTGAATLPPEVTKIHLDFGLRMDLGHMGARKFWRECLPRLKYHNPGVAMIVNRHGNNASPPIMTIYLRSQTAQPLQGPATWGRRAQNDLEEMRALDAMERLVAAARERNFLEMAQKKKEEDMIKKAAEAVSGPE
ncbi:hypothetical protein XA68_17408 [Ophiocordyceps unilateralis]|uniref:Ribosomal protein/NADH dehydrogenase domain-containing protein n=1 Tax=Ophiocordyceps unilateralis TaxID=268505 RepID=A0A2A9PKJ1_OPHUN|nr:hypothetical protein XA68_17408 [Ophiocordyceps unilateralis]